jgi:hypothetical protein
MVRGKGSREERRPVSPVRFSFHPPFRSAILPSHEWIHPPLARVGFFASRFGLGGRLPYAIARVR